jgi:hypothetical protein
MSRSAFGRRNSDATAKPLAGKGKIALRQLIEKQLATVPGALGAARDPAPLPSRQATPPARDTGGGDRARFVYAPLCDPMQRNQAAMGRGVRG